MGRGERMFPISLCLPREIIARLDRVRGLANRSAVIREAIFRFLAQEELHLLAEEDAPQKASRKRGWR